MLITFDRKIILALNFHRLLKTFVKSCSNEKKLLWCHISTMVATFLFWNFVNFGKL